jgi:hypothetical protein
MFGSKVDSIDGLRSVAVGKNLKQGLERYRSRNHERLRCILVLWVWFCARNRHKSDGRGKRKDDCGRAMPTKHVPSIASLQVKLFCPFLRQHANCGRFGDKLVGVRRLERAGNWANAIDCFDGTLELTLLPEGNRCRVLH